METGNKSEAEEIRIIDNVTKKAFLEAIGRYEPTVELEGTEVSFTPSSTDIVVSEGSESIEISIVYKVLKDVNVVIKKQKPENYSPKINVHERTQGTKQEIQAELDILEPDFCRKVSTLSGIVPTVLPDVITPQSFNNLAFISPSRNIVVEPGEEVKAGDKLVAEFHNGTYQLRKTVKYLKDTESTLTASEDLTGPEVMVDSKTMTVSNHIHIPDVLRGERPGVEVEEQVVLYMNSIRTSGESLLPAFLHPYFLEWEASGELPESIGNENLVLTFVGDVQEARNDHSRKVGDSVFVAVFRDTSEEE